MLELAEAASAAASGAAGGGSGDGAQRGGGAEGGWARLLWLVDGWEAAGAAGALMVALGVSSLVKALLLKHLLGAPVSNWRWALVYAAAPAVVVGYAFTWAPEWMELVIGIPAVLGTYALVIWRRGFSDEDKVLFRKQAASEANNDPA